jgi:hypothetical protein
MDIDKRFTEARRRQARQQKGPISCHYCDFTSSGETAATYFEHLKTVHPNAFHQSGLANANITSVTLKEINDALNQTYVLPCSFRFHQAVAAH